MPTDITTSIHATPIKWTHEEWNKIAFQLYQVKGTCALASEGVENIKARDVFEAQNVLPLERRRKQISIAQGFQQIRARLRSLFERGMQENLFPAAAPMQTDASHRGAIPAVAQVSTEGPMEEVRSSRAANRDSFPEGGPVSKKAKNEVENARTIAENGAVDGQPSHTVRVHSSGKAVEQRLEDVSQSATIAYTTPAIALEHVDSPISVVDHGNQLNAQADQPSPSLLEWARPFVAMVCEELTRALVQTFSEQESVTRSTSRQPSVVGGTVRQLEEPRSRQNLQRPDNINRSLWTGDDPRVGRTGMVEAGVDEVEHLTEVQPLFDPKLPPSADSDFKPTIGLLATRDHEYEDLQVMYPQLRLSIVQVENIHGAEAFRDCQRVIALRDEVPNAIQDQLKQALGYRYIWLRGGADRVREQLDAWLTSPSSMQAKPRSAASRPDKAAQDGNVKKRGKWPPRVA